MLRFLEKRRRGFVATSRIVALISSMAAFELGLTAEYFMSFMFFLNTLSVSYGSDILIREFGQRVSQVMLLRYNDANLATDIAVENMAGEVHIFPIEEVKPVQKEIAKSYLARKDVLKSYPVFMSGMLLYLSKDANIKHKELFKAVLSGHIIDLEQTLKRE